MLQLVVPYIFVLLKAFGYVLLFYVLILTIKILRWIIKKYDISWKANDGAKNGGHNDL